MTEHFTIRESDLFLQILALGRAYTMYLVATVVFRKRHGMELFPPPSQTPKSAMGLEIKCEGPIVRKQRWSRGGLGATLFPVPCAEPVNGASCINEYQEF